MFSALPAGAVLTITSKPNVLSSTVTGVRSVAFSLTSPTDSYKKDFIFT
jgi:hypothetical protein